MPHPRKLAFVRHPWGLWLRSPQLCCGAGPATLSYHEFLSVTSLGIIPCTTLHLENLFAGHTGNPLQKIVSQTWEPRAYREHNWKGSQPLLHELWIFRVEQHVWTTMFSKEKLQCLHISELHWSCYTDLNCNCKFSICFFLFLIQWELCLYCAGLDHLYMSRLRKNIISVPNDLNMSPS